MRVRDTKYEPLKNYLQSTDSKLIIMTFKEIEAVLGFELPPSASKYQAWWDESSQHTQAYAWTGAGFRVKPNFKEKKVDFIKYE
jgi:hypothetical protein